MILTIKPFTDFSIWNQKNDSANEERRVGVGEASAGAILVQYSSARLVNVDDANKSGLLINEQEGNNNQHNQIINELNDDFCSVSDLDFGNEEQQLNLIETQVVSSKCKILISIMNRFHKKLFKVTS